MFRTHHHDNDDGWVLLPAILLMVISLLIAFGLLVAVDNQRHQGAVQRTADAGQTLAEGLVSATSEALAQWTPVNAGTGESTPWRMTACTSVTGNLGGVTTGTTELEQLVRTAVNSRFNGTSGEFVSGAATWNAAIGTSWKVKVCPVTATNSARWDGSDPAAGTPLVVASPASLWVLGTSTLVRTDDRHARKAVVAKVRQSTASFTPPVDYAVGTGVFTTDLTVSTNSLLAGATDSGTLLGPITSALGVRVNPLIASGSKFIGVRCGLLNTLSSTGTTCLTGTTGGLGSTVNSLGLSALETVTGNLSRTQQLSTWTMAPDDATDAWKTEATASGTYYSNSTLLAATGNDNRTTGGPTLGTAPDCFPQTGTENYAGKVIYIQQVGATGNGFCRIRQDTTAKAIVVEKGAVVVQAKVKAVLYAMNKQETESHSSAPAREVIRIEGTSGSVTGQVWADGAGGAVGIYPNANTGTVPTANAEDLIKAITDNSGICGTYNGGTVLNGLNSAVTSVTNLVGQILGNVQLGTFTQTQYRPSPYAAGDSANPPTGCDYLKRVLRTYTTTQLQTLAKSGGTVPVPYQDVSTRSCTGLNILGIVTASCSAWTAWASDTAHTTAVTIPAGLVSNSGILSQVLAVLNTVNSSYSAIVYDATINAAATASVTTGAGPTVGSFRNVRPSA